MYGKEYTNSQIDTGMRGPDKRKIYSNPTIEQLKRRLAFCTTVTRCVSSLCCRVPAGPGTFGWEDAPKKGPSFAMLRHTIDETLGCHALAYYFVPALQLLCHALDRCLRTNKHDRTLRPVALGIGCRLAMSVEGSMGGGQTSDLLPLPLVAWF